MFYVIFPWWKLPYSAQRSIPRMIDEWFWKLQKSPGWLLVHEIREMCQPLHNCTISFGNSFNMCLWKRTKGFVTCLFNTCLHMGRLLSCFLTHQTFFTPGNAKLKSKFLKVLIVHTRFTLWNTSFIETNSKLKPRTIFGREPRSDCQVTCKMAGWGEDFPMLSGWQWKHMKVERKCHHSMWLSHWSSWRKTLSKQRSWFCSTYCKVVRLGALYQWRLLPLLFYLLR